MTLAVLNLKDRRAWPAGETAFIGRPSPWGNPYRIGDPDLWQVSAWARERWPVTTVTGAEKPSNATDGFEPPTVPEMSGGARNDARSEPEPSPISLSLYVFDDISGTPSDERLRLRNRSASEADVEMPSRNGIGSDLDTEDDYPASASRMDEPEPDPPSAWSEVMT